MRGGTIKEAATLEVSWRSICHLLGYIVYNGLDMTYSKVEASVERLHGPISGIFYAQCNIAVVTFNATRLLDSMPVSSASLFLLPLYILPCYYLDISYDKLRTYARLDNLT